MPAVRTPEASQPTRRIAVSGCSLPRREIGSATSITFDFGANPPFTCVPACNLSVYASQWLLPDTTQDSIHGCLAQALPWPPFQTAELNALARRNSRRTVHDTLASYGSHCSAAAIKQAPVGEQPCLAARNALQPVDGPRPVPVQGLELPTGPSRQEDIDVPQGRVERRRIEPTIVIDPTPDVRIEHPRQIIQRLVTALLKGPAAHGLTDLLESFVADRRTERDADLPSPSSRQPRPEGSSIPSFYMVAKVSAITRDCCRTSVYRWMRG